MRAVFYESNGSAKDVLKVGTVDTPMPDKGEVRVRLKTSGVNPSDVKTRFGILGKSPFPRVIPHSDGAGEIDAVGEGVSATRIGERVWIWNAQWQRAFGSGAEYVVLPDAQAVRLRHITRSGFGKELPIENNDSSRLSLIEKVPKLARHIPRGKNILTKKITRRFVVI